MKILLTGATGFIGTHFMGRNHSECIVPFSFRQDDIRSFDLTGYDAIIHLGALVHQMNGAEAQEYDSINTTRTLELAHKAKHSGVKHFLFMSTIKVYGEETETPYTENSLCQPKDPYGQSKLKAEQELFRLADAGFIVSVIRSPVVYGSGVKGNIHKLIQLTQRFPLLPLGSTRNRRSIVFVGNLCALMETILYKAKGGIFLASDANPVSTTELIQTMAKAMRKKTFLFHLPLFESLLKRFFPLLHQRLFGNLVLNDAHTRQQLDFSPPYSTNEGIRQMIEGNPS